MLLETSLWGKVQFTGPILESKAIRVIFRMAKKDKIFENLAKMYKVWKYFGKGQVIACDYRTNELLEKALVYFNQIIAKNNKIWTASWLLSNMHQSRIAENSIEVTKKRQNLWYPLLKPEACYSPHYLTPRPPP